MDTWGWILVGLLVIIFITALTWPTAHEGFSVGSKIVEPAKKLFDTDPAATFSEFNATITPFLGNMADANLYSVTKTVYGENPTGFNAQAIDNAIGKSMSA